MATIQFCSDITVVVSVQFSKYNLANIFHIAKFQIILHSYCLFHHTLDLNVVYRNEKQFKNLYKAADGILQIQCYQETNTYVSLEREKLTFKNWSPYYSLIDVEKTYVLSIDDVFNM